MLLKRLKLAWSEIPLAWKCAFKYRFSLWEFISLIVHIIFFVPMLPFYLLGFFDKQLEERKE